SVVAIDLYGEYCLLRGQYYWRYSCANRWADRGFHRYFVRCSVSSWCQWSANGHFDGWCDAAGNGFSADGGGYPFYSSACDYWFYCWDWGHYLGRAVEGFFWLAHR